VIHDRSAGSATWRLVTDTRHHPMTRSSSVYDMYPDWGPAKNRAAFEAAVQPDNTRSHEAVQASLDLRDNGGQRPDDN